MSRSELTFLEAKIVVQRKMGGLNFDVEEKKTFYFETDGEGLIFADYLKLNGFRVTNYGRIQSCSVNAAKADLQVLIELLRKV